MARLLLILAAIFAHTKSAKIYNALISSNENLQPSHAYPIVEPVFRSTALGVAFPPLIVQPNIAPQEKQVSSKAECNSCSYSTLGVQDNVPANEEGGVEKKQQVPELAYHGTLYPLAYDPYFPYAYTTDFLFPAALPFYQQPVFADFTPQPSVATKKQQQQPQQVPPRIPLLEDDPLKSAAAANFKKNPEIPDVPPPPLPVKTDKKRKE